MSGAAALRRLSELANPVTFSDVIKRLNFGEKEGSYDTRSCMMNNVAIVKTATKQAFAPGPSAGAMAGLKALGVPQGQSGQMTKAVMLAMNKPVLVTFGLKFWKGETGAGDHYFSVFPLDGNTVIVSMGWQGLYDYTEWFAQNSEGRFTAANFAALLGRIEGGDIAAVGALCAFLGHTRDGKSIPERLDNDLAGCKPRFDPAYMLDIPG